MSETKIDYGRCTEDAPYQPGSWLTRIEKCPRPATGDDGLCGPHRAGKRSRERADQRYAEQSRQRAIGWARDDYVRKWRAIPRWIWGDDWRCPLCNRILQTIVNGAPIEEIAAIHQIEHEQDWRDYMAAGQGAEQREDGG